MLPKHDRLTSRSWVSSAACRAPARIRSTTPRTDTTTWRTAFAGAAALCKFGGYDTSMRWVSGDDDSGAASERARLQTFINSEGRIRLWRIFVRLSR